MGNIRNRKTVAKRLWDWEFLNDVLPGKIRPMDIDGIIERNGHFLVLEGKPLGKRIKTGQRITLRQLSKRKNFSVLILYGEPGEPQEMKLLRYHEEAIKCSKEDVKELVGKWVKQVN